MKRLNYASSSMPWSIHRTLLGDQIYAFALSWYILSITNSSFAMATFLVINALVGFFISPFGGIIADRVNRKNIMIGMDVIRGLIVIVTALLLYLHMMQIWMLYISAIVLAICGSFFSPAASAIIPNVVNENQLTQATSMDQFIVNFCSIAGMVISGTLYNSIGIIAIFLLNAVSYFISGIMEALLNIPARSQIKNTNSLICQELSKVVTELREGYQYVKQKKLIFYPTLMFVMFNLIIFPFALIYLPYTFNVVLKASPFQLAIAIGSGFLGNMLGSCLVQLFSGRYKLRNSIIWGLFTWSVSIFGNTLLLFWGLKGYFSI